MNLVNVIKWKFSMVLMLASVLGLPVFASAQDEKIVFYSQRGGAAQIWSMNPDGSNPTNLSNNGFTDLIPDASATGNKIAFASTRDDADGDIYVMNGDGSNQTRLTDHPGWDYQPTISGDGSKVAFVSDRDGAWEIYVVNTDGTNLTRLTYNDTHDFEPSFSEDGTKIVFVAGRDGDSEIYVMNADGSDQTRLTYSPGGDGFPEFNAAGNKIVFQSFRNPHLDVYVMDADGKNQINVTNSDESEFFPTFSPDGSRIAFSTERDGDWEVYAVNADGSNPVNLTNFPMVEDLFGSWTSGGGAIGPPTEKEQCKNGGWKIFNFPRTFANQGDCVNFVKNGEISSVRQAENTTSASNHTGGANFAFGDGSVRFLTSPARDGEKSADGELNTDGSVKYIKASTIYLPNSPLEFDYVDSSDPNAESKTRALFDAAYRLRRGVVVKVPQGEIEVSGRVPVINFLISDGGDSTVLSVKLQECLITSYQVSGSGGAIPMESLSLNFTKIEYKNLP